jgi:6,7-dimethyl-8-ribityllumazine synthase
MATKNKNLSEYDKKAIPNAKGMVFAIIQSEWNKQITDNLFKGALTTLLENGAKSKDVFHLQVPGAFELPIGAQQVLINNKKIDAVICLGCVIQGDTRHFDFVCNGVTQGIMDVGLKFNKPVIFGVLTDNTLQQSKDRSGGKHGNKGIEAAITAIKMVHFQKNSNAL